MSTNPRMSRRRFAGALAAAAATTQWPALAQDTDRPVTLVVPYPAGALSDLFARTLANELGPILKRTIVVENRPGAGQGIAGTYVNRAAPNGGTLMISVQPNVLPPSVQRTLPYGANTDFVAVAHLVSLAGMLAVSPKVPAGNFREFVAYAKAHPAKLRFASSGIGSPHHLFTELLNQEAGMQAIHVPYRTLQTILPDLMQGDVDYSFMQFSAMQHVASGKLKVFGALAGERDPDYPQLPTLAEQGLKGFDATIKYFVVAPKGTPPEVAQRLNAAIIAAAGTPAFAAKMKPIGGITVPKPLNAAQTRELFAREDAKWLALVRDQKIPLE